MGTFLKYLKISKPNICELRLAKLLHAFRREA